LNLKKRKTPFLIGKVRILGRGRRGHVLAEREKGSENWKEGEGGTRSTTKRRRDRYKEEKQPNLNKCQQNRTYAKDENRVTAIYQGYGR